MVILTDIYMRQPEEYIALHHPNFEYRLCKSIHAFEASNMFMESRFLFIFEATGI